MDRGQGPSGSVAIAFGVGSDGEVDTLFETTIERFDVAAEIVGCFSGGRCEW